MKKLLILLFTLCWLCVPALAEEDFLDLTHLKKISDKEIPALMDELQQSPALCTVELRGVEISYKGMAQLREALPEVVFHWLVPIGSEVYESPVQHLVLDGAAKKAGAKTLQQALRCFTGLEEITMYDYRLSTREMESLMAEHPQVKFNWTIKLNNYLIRTDATAFSTAKGRQDPRYTAKMLDVLKYCPNLLALDVGHNNVSDLSFVAEYWPNLRRLICIDSRKPLKDLTPLTNLHDLEYVELFMQGITDISPLANKTKLKDLNLCYNDVTDLTPLHSCVNLERLWISRNYHLPQSEIDALQAALPNLVIETKTPKSTEAGWREHPRYFIMKESFDTRTYIAFDEVRALP